MKDVFAIYENCKGKLQNLGIETGEIKRVKVNTRAVSRWGRCKKVSYDMYEIEISAVLLQDDVDDKGAETTMLHELLHSCEGCMNHGAKWKALANKVNAAYGYNIKRNTSSDEKGVKDNIVKKAKHKIVCQKCGKEIYRMRASNLTKYPTLYSCMCGGDFKVEY